MQGSLVGMILWILILNMNIVFLGSAEGAVDPFGPWASGVTHFAPHCSFPPSSMMLYAVVFGSLFLSLSLSLW